MPGYAAVTCRLIHQVGERHEATYMWDRANTRHIHMVRLDISPEDYASGLDAVKDKSRASLFALRCDCGAAPMEEPYGFGMGAHRVWSTEDGQRHPGDMF